MEDGNGQAESAELARLRALGDWMRDVDATELSLGDVHIKLAPKPPAAPGRAQSATDPDEQAELSDEEKRLAKQSADERAHYAYWRRLTRSSGAPIPPYRPKVQ